MALWFLIPAGVANMAPVFAAKIPALKKLDTPLDFGKSLSGKRVFGKNKTWRGLIAGVVVATIVFGLQKLMIMNWPELQAAILPLDYAKLPVWILGPLFGVGALGGDAIKSFFKRRLNIAPGRSWFPLDQLDYVIGSLITTAFFVIHTPLQYALICIIWLVLHVVVVYGGWLLKIRKQPI